MLAFAPEAPDPPDAWQWEAAAVHRTLVERDVSGARLLKETGPLGRLRVIGPWLSGPAGRVDFSAALAYARLDYDGRTQAGAPLATTSHHSEGEAGLRWHPMRGRDWGEVWLSVDALWFRRDIAATAAAAGLRETSTTWLPGIGWTGPRWQLGGVPVRLQARVRGSVDHRLQIDYGGLFDASSFRGGRRIETAIGATSQLNAQWSASIEWQHTRQRASGIVPLYRGGAVAGTVFQPRIAIDDVGISISRRF